MLGVTFFVGLSKKRREKAQKTLHKIKLRTMLVVYTPSLVRLYKRRLDTIDKLIDVELSEIGSIDGTKTLVNKKVSLKRLAVLHANLNTLMEKAISNKQRVNQFNELTETYVKLVHRLT